MQNAEKSMLSKLALDEKLVFCFQYYIIDYETRQVIRYFVRKLQMLSKETSESHVRLQGNNNNNRMFNYNCLHIKNTLR